MLFRPPMFQGAGFGGLRVEVLGFKYLRVLGLGVIRFGVHGSNGRSPHPMWPKAETSFTPNPEP